MPGARAASRVALVVPCYNEAARFDAQAFAAALGDRPWLTLLFVDDGSRDATRSVLADFVARHAGQAELLALPRNMGKAEAVRRGLQQVASPGAICGFWDADLSAALDEVDALRGVLDRRPSVQWVWGIRLRALGRTVTRQPSRHYLGRLFATATSLLLGFDSYDTQCGAKLFRVTPWLEAVLAEPFRSRWIFDVEMLARFDALLRGAGGPALAAMVYEQPLGAWVHRAGSKVQGRDFLRAARELLVVHRARAGWVRPLAG